MKTRIIKDEGVFILQVLIPINYYPYFDWEDLDFAIGTA